jgi:hypothetical protein
MGNTLGISRILNEKTLGTTKSNTPTTLKEKKT